MSEGSPQQNLSRSAFAPFLKMTLEELKTLQVKLTYVGPQDEPIPSIAFTSQFRKLDMQKFVPYGHPGIHYGNDNIAVKTFAVTPQQLRSLISNVSSFGPITSGQVPKMPSLSFMLFNASKDGDLGFEALLDHKDSKELFIYLRNAIETNREAMRLLQWWGCALDLLPPIPARDVSKQVDIVRGGVHWNRRTGYFEQALTLTNISREPIAGPISVVVDMEGNVRPVDDDGTTCAISPVGRQFVNVPFPAGPYGKFAPEEKLELVLQFDVRDGEPIRYSTKVIAHPGER